MPDGRVRRFARRATVQELGGGLASATLSVALAVLVLRIWDADGAPLAYSGDAPFYAMVVKGILQHGWHLENPSLGAPAGQELYDFPIVSSDNAQALVVKLLGAVSSDWVRVVTSYFLLTFALTAASAYLVFRLLEVAIAPAVACSTLFALLPYHFARGASELFLSGYFAVPLGCWLVLSILGGRPLFPRRRVRDHGLLAFASSRTLGTVAACVLVGVAAGSYYYAAFTVVLVAGASFTSALVRREVRTLATGVLVVGLIAATLAVNAAPSLLYRAEHGANEAVGSRGRGESEIFALKLTQLVLPIEDHRVGALARASSSYAEVAPFGELGRPVHLGLVATVGFVWLLLVVVVRTLSPGEVRFAAAYRHAAGAALLAFLVATVGGVSVLIAAVTPQLRAWNRLSIFIAFFALLAIGLALTSLRGRLAHLRRATLVFSGVLAAIVLVGVLDQTSPRDTPRYDVLRAEYASDEAFVRDVERRLPVGAPVLELPYVPFPEAGLSGESGDYDQVRPYLHSQRLRWSFGAMKGRSADWLGARDGQQPIEAVLSAALADGFLGVTIDRAGYPDRGRAVEAAVSRFLDEGRPLISPDGRLVFFDLRARQRAATT